MLNINVEFIRDYRCQTKSRRGSEISQQTETVTTGRANSVIASVFFGSSDEKLSNGTAKGADIHIVGCYCVATVAFKQRCPGKGATIVHYSPLVIVCID